MEEKGGGYSDSSSDDEHTWTAADKQQWKRHVMEQKQAARMERQEKTPKFFELKEGVEFGKSIDEKKVRKEKK